MKFLKVLQNKFLIKKELISLRDMLLILQRKLWKFLSEMGVPVAIKAQVLTGGRGKAGGVKFAKIQVKLLKLQMMF